MPSWDKGIRPLKFVESQTLQALVTEFSLSRRESGVGTELSVEFSDNTPTISTKAENVKLKESIKEHFDKLWRKYRDDLDAVLIDGTRRTFPHKDMEFPFRYASGGTLPIVHREGVDYYCFFYRDTFPIGWNIANGGCCTREELLNPRDAIERELREELVILDLFKRIQYVFGRDDSTQSFRPHRVDTHRGYLEFFPELAHGSFTKEEANIKRIKGPDSVMVSIDADRNPTEGYFLNINAEDYGIEFDEVAKIAIHRDVVLFDGEQTRSFLLNRVVGLFRVDTLDQHVNQQRFIPDLFFHSGKLFQRGENGRYEDLLDERRDAMVERLNRQPEMRSDEQKKHFEDCKKEKKDYDLCPVTRSIVKRYTSRVRGPDGDASVKIFISYGGDDESIAKKVHNFLSPTMETFLFWEHRWSDSLSASIDEALESARCLILVGTTVDNITRENCRYEWRRFRQDKFKPPGSNIILFTEQNLNESELPPELRRYFHRRFNQSPTKDDLAALRDNLPPGLKRPAP